MNEMDLHVGFTILCCVDLVPHVEVNKCYMLSFFIFFWVLLDDVNVQCLVDFVLFLPPAVNKTNANCAPLFLEK